MTTRPRFRPLNPNPIKTCQLPPHPQLPICVFNNNNNNITINKHNNSTTTTALHSSSSSSRRRRRRRREAFSALSAVQDRS